MSENDNNEEPKIIVDEDWKSQVEREKEEINNAPAEDSGEQDESGGELPPASMLGLISMFATQAMAALGLLVDPSTGQSHVSRPMAKHFIDMLGLRQEKTQGNLDEEESGHLRDALHQLRMVYVQTGNMPDGDNPEEPPAPQSSIEIP